MKILKDYRGPIAFFAVFLVFCLVFPVHFLADDFEHLYFYHRGIGPQKILFWVHRNPFHSLWHIVFFPLFVKNWFFLGKFILWGLFILCAYWICDLYIKDFRIKVKTHFGYAFLPFVMAFPMNNYEWHYWPTCMTMVPSLIIIVFAFHRWAKNPTTLNWLIKNIAYVVGFFTFETLLPMVVLWEVAHCVYITHKESNLFTHTTHVLKQTLLGIGLSFFLKWLSNIIWPYGYAAKFGFKWHLFTQFLYAIFSADYYKHIYATGSVIVLAQVLFLILRFKQNGSKKTISTDILILFLMVLSGVFYFVIMDYSSRRALAGHMYFYWCLLVLGVLHTLKKVETTKKWKIAILTPLIFSFFWHHAYVARFKSYEKKTIEEITADVKSKIKNSDKPIELHWTFPKRYFHKRNWNFVDRPQVQGYIFHYFTKQEQERIILK